MKQEQAMDIHTSVAANPVPPSRYFACNDVTAVAGPSVNLERMQHAVRALQPRARTALSSALHALDTRDREVVLSIDGAELRLTHLDKVLWPAGDGLRGYTRRDYMRYLLQMAPHLLRHLHDRPLTLIRQPE